MGTAIHIAKYRKDNEIWFYILFIQQQDHVMELEDISDSDVYHLSSPNMGGIQNLIASYIAIYL